MDGRISKMDNQAQAMSASTPMEGALNTLHNSIGGAESLFSTLEKRLISVAEPESLSSGNAGATPAAPESSMVVSRISSAETRVNNLYSRIESLLSRLHT